MRVKREVKYDKKWKCHVVREFDMDGNLLYHAKPGFEEWFTYDDKNQVVYSKIKFGNQATWEYIYDYDERGNCISKTHINTSENGEVVDFGYREEWEYDENNNEIYHKDGEFEIWRKYDKFGNCIYRKDSTGKEIFYNYDDNGIKLLKSAQYEFYDEEE